MLAIIAGTVGFIGALLIWRAVAYHRAVSRVHREMLDELRQLLRDLEDRDNA